MCSRGGRGRRGPGQGSSQGHQALKNRTWWKVYQSEIGNLTSLERDMNQLNKKGKIPEVELPI